MSLFPSYQSVLTLNRRVAVCTKSRLSFPIPPYSTISLWNNPKEWLDGYSCHGWGAARLEGD